MSRGYLKAAVFACLRLVLCAQDTDFYSDIPDAGFLRRAYHSSVLLNNDTVIVDSGEIAQIIGSKQVPTNLPMNFTLSIDMSSSWNPSNVPWTSINKTGSYPLNNQVLWPSKDGKTCYGFGGETSELWVINNLNPTYGNRPADLYQFTLNGPQTGNWTTSPAPSYRSASQSSIFQPLVRPSQALGATVDNTGFIVRGVEDHNSQNIFSDLDSPVPIPGIASYNISSSSWSNDTTPDSVANTFLIGVPSFGPSGLLLSSGSTGIGASSQALNNLTIYEPIAKSWHVQSTTGGPPLIRNAPCTVGVAGDNGTYEIFLYAGEVVTNDRANLSPQQITNNKALDEVWVLSLPAFAWFKANYTAQATRYLHTCHVVGNRQMLTIGGDNPNDRNSGTLSKDPARQGLQTFDLTEMTWTQGYDAGAAPYVSPQVVKDWYSTNTVPQYSDPALSGFFKASTQTSGLPASSPSPTSSPISQSSNTGAIAGGVVGGVVGLAIILGLLWFFLIRRRNTKMQQQQYQKPPMGDTPQQQQQYSDQEGQSKWWSPDAGGTSEQQKVHELHPEGMAPEMDAMPRSEPSGPFEVGNNAR